MSDLEREISLNAELLFDRYKNHAGRDPATVPQTWQFSIYIPEGEINQEILQPLVDQITEILQPTGDQLDVENEFIDDADDSNITITFGGTMQQDQLAAIHSACSDWANQCEDSGQAAQYMGGMCFADDVMQDADERYLIESQVMGMDWNEPRLWVFTSEYPGVVDEPRSHTLMVGVDAILEFDESSGQKLGCEVNVAEEDDDEPARSLVQVKYQGGMTLDQLRKLHAYFVSFASSIGGTYYGVFPEDVPEELSPEQMADWTEDVLSQTTPDQLEDLLSTDQEMREEHLGAVEFFGQQAADWMPTASQRFDLSSLRLRPKEEIIRRMMAGYICTAWVCAPPEVVPSLQVQEYLKNNGLKKRHFAEHELQWMQSGRAKAAESAGRAGWIFENIWGLAWLLGFGSIITPDDHQIPDQVLSALRDGFFLGLEQTFDGFQAACHLRPIEEVVALEDLMYCFHNAERNEGNDENAALMQERRRSLTWALTPDVSWDETDVST